MGNLKGKCLDYWFLVNFVNPNSRFDRGMTRISRLEFKTVLQFICAIRVIRGLIPFAGDTPATTGRKLTADNTDIMDEGI